ncbi:MAG: hypothetical protein HYW91_01900 [Candidatus Sungbacteria bacterium]|nr:hypothetical protein [Candidatus Sungbacteria bacterium]
MSGNFCFPVSFIRGRILIWAAAAVFLLVAGLIASDARAQTSQFRPGDRNYAAALAAIAAEEAKKDVNVDEKVQSDEDFRPEDFGLQSVGMLPTSPFYFLKNARRGVTSFFTFDPARKVERNMQFAAEKLLEAKALAESEGTDTEDIKNALDNFEQELDRVKTRVENAAESVEGAKAEDLSQKVMDSVVKYGKSITKLEKELPSEIFVDVKDAKDKNAETFGAVFNLVEPEKASEKLVEVLDKQKGSEFKQFKNLEVLKEVRDKAPKEAKGAIKVVEDNSFLKLQNGLERFDPGQRALFEDFVRQTGGSELRHLEIINELEARPLSKELRETVAKAKEGTISRTGDRLSKLPAAEKDKFFEHLKEGELKDVRVVKELENNVRPEFLAEVSEVKKEVTQNFVKKLESTTGEEKQKLLEGVERFHDAKSIAILDEIKNLIPEDKKGVFEELKQKAAQEIKRDIDRARNKDQREVILSSLAGDHPEEAAAMERFRTEVDRSLRGVFDGLRDAVLKGIQTRVESINDKDRLLKFEEEFKQQENIFRGASQSVRNINNFFDDRRVIFESPDKARKRIDEARKYVNDLRDLANSLPLDLAYQDGKFDPTVQEVQRMLQLAERKLDTAETVLGYNDVGRAYGEANAAEQIARDAIRFAQEFKSGKKRAETQTTTFIPFFEGQPSVQTGVKREGGFMIYSPYELSQYCFFVQGYMKGPLACVLQDGRVFNIEGRAFPLEIPSEFVPRKIESVSTPPGQTACQTTFAPSFDFCPNGKVVYEKDKRGCDLTPRCEPYKDQQQIKIHPTDKSVCGGLSEYQCVSGYRCQYPDVRGNYAIDFFGKCVPETQYTCQAEWRGFVFDSAKKTCRAESATGCSSPFTFSTMPECEKANNIGVKTGPQICPALSTIDICPAGQKKVVSYSSPDCGTYYACEQEKTPVGIIYPYTFTNGFVAKDYSSAKAQCLANPPGSGGGIATECEMKFGIVYGVPVPVPTPTTGNWVKKLWYFSDGLQETSFILNRTDAEYQNYIAKIEAQCKTISKNRFTWKSGAGDDRAENWQNFGIPDCSGTATVSTAQCSDGKDNDGDGLIDYPQDAGCYGAEDNDETPGTSTTYQGDANSCPGFAYSRWDSTGKRYCQLNSERRCDYNYPSYLTNGANYKTESCPATDSTGGGGGTACSSYSSQTSCTSVSGCSWSTAASGGWCQSTTTTTASGSCSQSLIALLGTGCHWMYSDSSGKGIYCDSPMSKSAKEGDTTTTAGCQSGTTSGGGTGVPAAPTGLSHTISADWYVTLRWTDNSTNETSYKIERRSTATTDWIQEGTTPTVSGGSGSYTTYNPLPSGEWEFVVKACNAGDCSAPSNSVKAMRSSTTTSTTTTTTTTTPKYPGFFMTPNKQSYTKGEVIALTIKRADVSTYPYYVDFYANETSSAKTAVKQNLDVSSYDGITTSIDTSATEPFKSGVSGTYLLLICAAGETCTGGTNTNSVTVSYAAAAIPAPACSSPGSCTNSADCSSSGYYWCSNVNSCYSSASSCPTTSTSACSTPGNCYDSAICTSSGWFWYNAGCWSSPQSGTSTSCPSGQYWSGTACVTSTSGGGSTSACSAPSSCYDSATCSSSGWYWYNGGCWSYPQSGTGTACSADQYWNGSTCVANTTTTTSTTCSSSQYWNGTACVTYTSGGTGGGCGSWPSQSDCTSHTGCLWNSTGNYCYVQ